MKKIVRTFLIIFAFTFFFNSCGYDIIEKSDLTSNQEKNTKEINTTINSLDLFEYDKQINNFLFKYNSIAEFPFQKSEIKKGNIRSKANISFNGIWIEIVNAKDGYLSIAITDSIEESKYLYPIFRDLLKSCNNSTNLEIESVWQDLKAQEYSIDFSWKNFEKSYCLNENNIQVSYLENKPYYRVLVNLAYKYK